jgi:hypothetical protein
MQSRVSIAICTSKGPPTVKGHKPKALNERTYPCKHTLTQPNHSSKPGLFHQPPVQSKETPSCNRQVARLGLGCGARNLSTCTCSHPLFVVLEQRACPKRKHTPLRATPKLVISHGTWCGQASRYACFVPPKTPACRPAWNMSTLSRPA